MPGQRKLRAFWSTGTRNSPWKIWAVPVGLSCVIAKRRTQMLLLFRRPRGNFISKGRKKKKKKKRHLLLGNHQRPAGELLGRCLTGSVAFAGCCGGVTDKQNKKNRSCYQKNVGSGQGLPLWLLIAKSARQLRQNPTNRNGNEQGRIRGCKIGETETERERSERKLYRRGDRFHESEPFRSYERLRVVLDVADGSAFSPRARSAMDTVLE